MAHATSPHDVWIIIKEHLQMHGEIGALLTKVQTLGASAGRQMPFLLVVSGLDKFSVSCYLP